MYYYPVSAVLTECLILSVVEQQDSYGYEISQTVKMVASIKESTPANTNAHRNPKTARKVPNLLFSVKPVVRDSLTEAAIP